MASEEAYAAAVIRDHIGPLVRTKGHVQPVGPTSQFMWNTGQFRFAVRTVLSPEPLLSNAPAYAKAQGETEAHRMLPNGMDIWHNEKVLSIEWDEAELKVIMFERGPWEQDVLLLSEGASTPEHAAQRNI
jgi:hypothetical protein